MREASVGAQGEDAIPRRILVAARRRPALNMSSLDPADQLDSMPPTLSSEDSLLGLHPQSPTSVFGCIPQFDGPGDDLISFADVPSSATPLLPGRGDVITGTSFSFILLLFLSLYPYSSFSFLSVQAQVHAPDLRKRVRVDSWSGDSDLNQNPPTPKRAKTHHQPATTHHQPGPPVSGVGRRSRNLSSSSVLSIAESHGSTPSQDSGLGRSFVPGMYLGVPGSNASPPKGIQVRSFILVILFIGSYGVPFSHFLLLLFSLYSVSCHLSYHVPLFCSLVPLVWWC